MNAQLVPIPQIPVSVRAATLADVPFIDQLQKLHADRVGFMRTSWIEQKIKAGQLIVAEEPPPLPSPASGGGMGGGLPVGYVMGVDRYFKRDDVGIIHQLNVVPGKQRGYVGMALLKAMFDRAAYGCRLFCCWCAQDIDANRFWEAMGFVPLAYRAGSKKKSRVHIFWQKRVREGDNQTPWWFPSQTSGGALNADRLVLPIPPGKHWADELPVLLPAARVPVQAAAPALPDRRHGLKTRDTRKAQPAGPGPGRMGIVVGGRIKYVARPGYVAPAVAPSVPPVARKAREKAARAKIDPKLLTAARELRDRWLEHVNGGGETMLIGRAKYDVARAIEAPAAVKAFLPSAAA